MKVHLVGFALALALASGSIGSRQIFLTSGSIDTTAAPSIHAPLPKRSPGYESSFLIHLSPAVSIQSTRLQLEEILEQRLDRYYPHNTFLFCGSAEKAFEASRHPHVLWVGEYLPEQKLSPNIESCGSISGKCRVMTTFVVPQEESLMDQWRLQYPGVKFILVSPRRSESLVEAHEAYSLAKFMASHPQTQWVEALGPWQYHNKWASWVIQSNSPTDYSLWNEGLHGEGEYVGLGDSGIDWDMCFFNDPANPVPFEFGDSSHRKIYKYLTTYGDSSDTADGHGTHMAGTIAGEALNTNDTLQIDAEQFNGVAYKAKLTFIDLNSGDNLLTPPSDLYADYFPPAYSGRARVMASGFGSISPSYTALDEDVDLYTWENDEFLPIFSAGNDGFQGFGTVATPGTAKNALSVGAALSDKDTHTFHLTSPEYTAIYQEEYAKYCSNPPAPGAYDDQTLCESLGYMTTPCDEAKDLLCQFFNGPADCCNFQYFYSKCCIDNLVSRIIDNPLIWNRENLAMFSSIGPTFDGRIKPDIVAPGDRVFSAKSDGDTTTFNCGLYEEVGRAYLGLSGTSQAAAVMTGGAALVRQYFREGYYPGGYPNVGTVIQYPPASLVKATLINSGQRLIARSSSGTLNPQSEGKMQTLGDFPSFYQGFGRSTLEKTLRFNSSTFDMLVFHNQMVAEGESWRQCITVTGNSRPLKITLVWTDYPASPGAGIALVNNLDLLLVDGSKKEYRSNFGDGFDAQNNVEQVIVTAPTTGLYSVLVHGTKIPQPRDPIPPATEGKQPFALVVTGQVQTSASCTAACPNDCSLHGTCTDGLCACDSGWLGPDCSFTSCPDDCSSNGLCDFLSGTCICGEGWTGTNCATVQMTGTSYVEPNRTEIIQQGISKGAFAGTIVAIFIFAGCVGFCAGGVMCVVLIRRKALKRKQSMEMGGLGATAH